MVPFYLHEFPPPSAGDADVQGNVELATFAQIDASMDGVGEERESGLGRLFVTTSDCNGERAKGVSFAADVVAPETFIAYVDESGLPSSTLTATSTRGEGVIGNLPPGYVTVRGISTEVGLYFEQTVLVVADSITAVPIVPSPR